MVENVALLSRVNFNLKIQIISISTTKKVPPRRNISHLFYHLFMSRGRNRHSETRVQKLKNAKSYEWKGFLLTNRFSTILRTNSQKNLWGGKNDVYCQRRLGVRSDVYWPHGRYSRRQHCRGVGSTSEPSWSVRRNLYIRDWTSYPYNGFFKQS